ncbi:MAG: beta-galactosidase [Bacteroidales bacterium]|nr:beta-galactosidase [Bacteroidales bacterium]
MKPIKFVITLWILFQSSFLFSQKTDIVFLSGKDAAHTVEWDFFCTEGRNSGHWTKIQVPSNWELQGFGVYNYGHDWKNNDRILGKEQGLYKHTFSVPNDWKGKTINIVFDGSMTDTKVKINGKSAGEIHQGAFNRFKYDISKLLKYGQENLLEVDVAKHSANESVNKAERQADFWIFGGIYRPVFLEVIPPIHMKRTAIDAKSDGSFGIFIELNKSNANYAVDVDLYGTEGIKIGPTVSNEIAKGTQEKWVKGNFHNIQAWNPEWPNLYQMKITLKENGRKVHELTEKVGFRTVELRNHDGIYINNEKIVFKGVNRHSFWPETGRCLSEENHLTDIKLMKEMNMNVVRMSHYVPDKRFLELCDSIGLFVLNEVTGWQDGYDTVIGPKLIKETVLKDENHPSVVIWDHGNEGGWNFANEKWIGHWDIQNRPVICPWLLHNGIDTHHYPDYSYALGRYKQGNAPFMPTEFLHGLYDGGLGAGLDDFWTAYQSSPLHAGGFLWVFSDEAVLRTDMEGTVFDSDGNHAPDGILGPHREKEGSFYTIKEIWSPVQIKPLIINKQWNGRLFLENKFLFTNLNQCSFTWNTFRSRLGNANPEKLASGAISVTEALPGETALVKIELKDALDKADIFQFTATDPYGKEIYTWSWPVIQSKEKTEEWLNTMPAANNDIKVEVRDDEFILKAIAEGIEVSFNKNTGTLSHVKNSKGEISLTGGRPVGCESKVTSVSWEVNENGDFEYIVNYDNYPKRVKWILHKNGLLYFEAGKIDGNIAQVDFIGVTFDYPEQKCTSIKWMGLGPYRVWKNRLKGSNFGVWEKAYNNTITGERFNELIYPEFKGYHGNLYWAEIENSESDFTILTETPNLYFQLFTPDKPGHMTGGTYPPFPEGDLSFLYEIPSVGTKFKKVESLGPSSQKGYYSGKQDDENNPIKLWFDFHVQDNL